jgi:hypothetical protein
MYNFINVHQAQRSLTFHIIQGPHLYLFISMVGLSKTMAFLTPSPPPPPTFTGTLPRPSLSISPCRWESCLTERRQKSLENRS